MRSRIFGRKRAAATAAPPEPLTILTVSGVEPVVSHALGRRKGDLKFDRLFVPSMVADYTFLLLRSAGINGNEKFIAWAGIRAGTDAIVTTVVNPRAASSGMHGEIPAEVVARVFEALNARDLLPLAQVHSHPAGSEISSTDRQRPMVAIKGFWSVIIPDFGFGASVDTANWGVYEYESPRNWHSLDENEITRRLVVDDSVIKVD